MILQALYDLAESEGLMSDPDYEPKPVAYIVRVGDGGRLIGIESTKSPPESGKGKPTAKSFSVPRQEVRTSGDKAQFLVDKAEYVFGIDPAGSRSSNKLQIRFDLFRKMVEECSQKTSDEGMQAVSAFLSNVSQKQLPISLPDDCESNDLFTFVYGPDIDQLVCQRETIRNYWKSLRSEIGGDQGQCLVTGEISTIVRLLDPIKRVPGGSTSGIGLVTFNFRAAESHGWDGNENAPISREAAEAISTALNRLLHPAYPEPGRDGQTLPRRNLRLSSDTAVCYWTREGDTPPIFGILEVNADDVGELYHAIWKGIPVILDDPSAFYALTLTGTQGRVIIRNWIESTVSAVQDNLAQHFADLDIVRNAPPGKRGHPPSFPMTMLLESIADPKDNRQDGVPAPLAANLTHSALTGRLYPRSAMQRAVMRYRAELGNEQEDGQRGWRAKNWNDARAALIKAELNRRHRKNHSWQEVRRTMDTTNTNAGYLLGRLMALIERMQREALGDVNASVVDRYFSAASASPSVVFPRLMKNLRHHARKVKDDETKRGRGRWLEGLVDEVVNKIDHFPSHLSIDDQGLFIIGFHHQRAAFWEKRESGEAVESTELATQ